MTKRIRLTKKGFRGWLEGKPGRMVVGYSQDRSECPIAKYLHDTGVYYPCVQTDTFGHFREPSQQQLPRWAKRFVNKIDDERDAITARLALAVLDGKEPTQ